MKLNNYPFRTAALLLVMLAAACTKEDDFAAPPDKGTATAAPLTITVTDGAYAPAESPDDDTPATRAVDHDYGKEFTAGDRIGLYVVEMQDASNPSNSNRTFLHENLCLTHDGTGWTLPAGTELTHRPSAGREILYFACYPYQSDMTDKVSINADDASGHATTEARWFFRPLIDNWTPATDQRTYEAYTASDLMVARGEATGCTDGTDGFVLSFTMAHQMALAVIRLPMTKCTYTETIGNVTTTKSYRLYSGLTIKGWLANDDTYRYLVNPKRNMTIQGSYYNSSLQKKTFNGTSTPDSPGKYVLYTIDGGGETVTERPLREGDFYMSDGGILTQEKLSRDMSSGMRADCLGVVFWVGENEGQHWTQTGWREGDRLLMRDHPGCTHGMVVALCDASAGAVWAEGSEASESLYNWANSFTGFNAEEQADWSEIQASAIGVYGYCTSHLVKLYGTHHPDAIFPAYNTIIDYAALHPAPGNSSGWFFSSRCELAMMCYGKADHYDVDNPTTRRDFLNSLFLKAGGEALDGSYWSSWDLNDAYAWFLDFAGNTSYGDHPKSKTNKVRAVLAF